MSEWSTFPALAKRRQAMAETDEPEKVGYLLNGIRIILAILDVFIDNGNVSRVFSEGTDNVLRARFEKHYGWLFYYHVKQI